MLPIRVTIETAKAEQKIVRLKNGTFANYSSVLRGRVATLVRDSLRKQFETEGEYGGAPWEELKQSTIARKMRAGFGDKGILRRTDRLYDSLTKRGDENQEISISKKSLAIRSKVLYAKRHQAGNDFMAARPPIPDPMPAEFLGSLRNIIRGYLVEAVLS